MTQTLTDIKQLLAAHGLRPKHRLGQNFLHDHNHLRRILEAADLQPGQQVLEVGPGTGALTEQLLAAGARVVAVEIDRDLEPILRTRLAEVFGEAMVTERFHLIVGDALAGKHALSPAVLEALGDKPFKLIANLPYQVASPLLANLATDHPAMSDAVVMIQNEVADRLMAGPGGKDYGPLGIVLQAMCEIRVVGKLSPGCFWPPPTITSAVVHLRRRDRPLIDQPRVFSDFLHRLFSKRRKQLGSILGRDTPLPPGIEADVRPETLSVEQLLELMEFSAQ